MERREFIKLIGAAGVAAGTVGLTACSTEEDETAATDQASASDAPSDTGTTPSETVETGTETEAPPSTIRVAAPGSPSDGLDPAMAMSSATWIGIYALYESLVANFDGTPVMQLAETIEPNETADVWTITLRDAVFSDGSPVTAEDARASLEHTSSSMMVGSTLSSIDFETSVAVDEKTLELHLLMPRADLIENVLAFQSIVMKDGDPEQQIGSGPFMLDAGSSSEGFAFVHNPEHPNNGAQRLEVRPVADPSARLSAVEAGEVDFAVDLPATAARTISGDAHIIEYGAANAKGLGIVLNTRVAPFDDERARTAMKLLIDRQALVNTVLSEGATIGADFLGKGLPGYPAGITDVTRDVERATELLAELGIDTLTLITADVAAGMNDAAELMVTQCAEAGLTLEIDRRDPSSYYTEMATLMEQPMFVSYWLNRTVSSALPFITGTNGMFNLDGFGADEAWDARLADVAATIDPAERETAVEEMAVEAAANNGLVIWGFQPFLDSTTDAVGQVPVNQTAPVFGDPRR